MAKVLEIRPISVTENLQYNLLSRGAKLFWMVGTLIQMLSLTIFSLRVDRIWDKNYLSNHWKHYSGTISTKSFQKVLNTGLKMFLFFYRFPLFLVDLSFADFQPSANEMLPYYSLNFPAKSAMLK